MSSKSSARSRRLTHQGWLPNQHGAWAMLLVPLLLGVIMTAQDAGWLLIPLTVAWIVGYCCFFAACLWIRATPSRRRVFARPVLFYGAITILAAVILVAARPYLLWWALPFGTLVGIALVEAYRRRPRSLLSGISEVTASSLLVPVCYSIGEKAVPGSTAWLLFLLLLLYFNGTIVYVKTLIRERGSHAWWIGSVAYHAIAFAITAYLTASGTLPWIAPVVFLLLTIRAAWIPYASAHATKPFSPRQVGLGEIAGTVGIIIAILATAATA